MRIPGRAIVVAAAAALLVFGGTTAILAATAPEIVAVTIGLDTATNRAILTIVGKSLTKFTGFALTDSQSQPVPGTVDILVRGKSMLVLGLPTGIAGGEYDLTPALKTGPGPVLHLRVDGPDSTAMGESTTASGLASTAMGFSTTASGQASTAMGFSTIASGDSSVAMGDDTEAIGDYSTATGFRTRAYGDSSTAMGVLTTAQSYGSLALGKFNIAAGSTAAWISTDPVLVVGNGSDVGNLSNAFTLLKNGNLTIAGTLTENSDERLKKEVTPLAGVLRKIAAIRGVSYRLKDETRGPAGTQIGLLAQEVREVFPELVHEDTQGTLSVAYGNFSAVLLEAIKEQQVALDAREREVAALKKELAEEHAATEARLSRLEALLAGGPASAQGK